MDWETGKGKKATPTLLEQLPLFSNKTNVVSSVLK